MKSRRSWLVGLALGAALFFGTPSAKASVPNGISYQGVLTENGSAATSNVQMDFFFADTAAGSLTLFHQTIQSVTIGPGGIFNVVLGPFPATMDFNQQYAMTI